MQCINNSPDLICPSLSSILKLNSTPGTNLIFLYFSVSFIIIFKAYSTPSTESWSVNAKINLFPVLLQSWFPYSQA